MFTSQSDDSNFGDNQMIKHEIQNVNGDNDYDAINNVNDDTDAPPEVTINNVVSHFSVNCELNLRYIAKHGSNVIHKPPQGWVLMKLRDPRVTAKIGSKGNITMTGARTEEMAKRGARIIERILYDMGFDVKLKNYRIVNVFGSCRLPFGIQLKEFSDFHSAHAKYEPEIQSGVTYRFSDMKAVLKLFYTGSLTIIAPCIGNVQTAVERIYPLVYEYQNQYPIQIEGQ